MEYDSEKHLLIPEVANHLIRALNSLLRLEIKKGGTAPQVLLSDDKVTIVLPDNGLDQTNSSSSAPFHINTPNQGTANFKDITVNNGYLSFTHTTPAKIDAVPYAGPWLNGSNDPVSLTVPDDLFVYVYLYFTGSNWIITCASTDDATWIRFGQNDNSHIIIGRVDSITNAGDQELIVTQLYEGNLYWPTSGNINNVDFKPVLVLDSPGSGLLTPNHSMVRGLVAGGFPADGLYLYTGSGVDVGPGGNYSVLAID